MATDWFGLGETIALASRDWLSGRGIYLNRAGLDQLGMDLGLELGSGWVWDGSV